MAYEGSVIKTGRDVGRQMQCKDIGYIGIGHVCNGLKERRVTSKIVMRDLFLIGMTVMTEIENGLVKYLPQVLICPRLIGSSLILAPFPLWKPPSPSPQACPDRLAGRVGYL